jgi:hypothetical protein
MASLIKCAAIGLGIFKTKTPPELVALLGIAQRQIRIAILPRLIPSGFNFRLLTSYPPTRFGRIQARMTPTKMTMQMIVLAARRMESHLKTGIFTIKGRMFCSMMATRNGIEAMTLMK